jgi:hypothetical protein
MIQINEQLGEDFRDNHDAVDRADSESGDVYDDIVPEFRFLEPSDVPEAFGKKRSFLEFCRSVPKQVTNVNPQFLDAFHGSFPYRFRYLDDFPENFFVLVLVESGKFFLEGSEVFRRVYDGDQFVDFLLGHFRAQPAQAAYDVRFEFLFFRLFEMSNMDKGIGACRTFLFFVHG